MPNTQRPTAAQQLRSVAEQERVAELTKNEFRETSEEYSFSKVPEEINGAFKERTKLTVMNIYNESNDYKNPDAE